MPDHGSARQPRRSLVVGRAGADQPRRRQGAEPGRRAGGRGHLLVRAGLAGRARADRRDGPHPLLARTPRRSDPNPPAHTGDRRHRRLLAILLPRRPCRPADLRNRDRARIATRHERPEAASPPSPAVRRALVAAPSAPSASGVPLLRSRSRSRLETLWKRLGETRRTRTCRNRMFKRSWRQGETG